MLNIKLVSFFSKLQAHWLIHSTVLTGSDTVVTELLLCAYGKHCYSGHQGNFCRCVMYILNMRRVELLPLASRDCVQGRAAIENNCACFAFCVIRNMGMKSLRFLSNLNNCKRFRRLSWEIAPKSWQNWKARWGYLHFSSKQWNVQPKVTLKKNNQKRMK